MNVKYFILFNLFFFVFYYYAFSQKHPLRYYGELGGVPTSDNLPFWLRTNQYGKYSEDSYLWSNFNLTYDFKHTDTKKFDYALGIEGIGVLGQNDNKAFLNQLFGRMRWQRLLLDIGVINRPELYGGLSATNGDMLYSNNSRSMPGISLSTADYITIPWTKNKLAMRAVYAEYRMNDNRYAGKKTNLHYKMGAIKFTPSSRFNVEVGANHYAQWGGETEAHGKIPSSFKDYIRVVFCLPGGSDSPTIEEDNKLGNHIGSYFLNATYSLLKWDITFNYNHMFEDASGKDYRNFPDGLYGVYLKRNSGAKWIEGILAEFYYTKDQSGRHHYDGQGNIIGGNDNYFNNGLYRSGWTFHGNMIGTPFFTTIAPDINGRTLGVYNNRFVAYHGGINGTLPLDIKYKILISFSQNYGTNNVPFYNDLGEETHRNQLSVGMQFILPETFLPFNTAVDIGFDNGKLLNNNFGIMLRIFKSGLF